MTRHRLIRLYTLEFRSLEHHHDGRCFNGAYGDERYEWGDWRPLELEVPEYKIEARLAWWRDLNDYAVSQRGDSALQQFRATHTGLVEIP